MTQFGFNFCPDTTDEQQSIQEELRQTGVPNDLGSLQSMCDRLSVRAQVFNERGDYAGHVFDDGTLSADFDKKKK